MNSKQAQWSSSWAFILATAGSAVGLGNIWKFPYIVGENGGGAFVLVYLVCVIAIGIPLMMAEVVIGRAGGADPETSFRKLAKRYKAHKAWDLLGYMLVLVGFIILSYYSVIAGWAVAYVFKAASGIFHHSQSSQVNLIFNVLVSSPFQLAFWHTLVIFFTVTVVSLGVEKGLERTVIYLLPAMFILLLMLVAYSMGTGFFGKGVSFLFAADFSKLTSKGILIAVGHAFVTLSLATGIIIMYGAYLPKSISIPKTCVFIAIADTVIALLAGLAIFPLVFAHGLEPGAGPGLIFKTLPLAFGQIPLGSFFGTLFFIMLVFAAFTSAISLLEPSVSWSVKKFNWTRTKAACVVGFLIWLLGFATIFSFNIWQNVKILGLNCFDFLDSMASNFMLPIGGVLISLFAVWVFKDANKELGMKNNSLIYNLWRFCLGIITPIAILVVFLNLVGLIHVN